jgi:hypothetical protein
MHVFLKIKRKAWMHILFFDKDNEPLFYIGAGLMHKSGNKHATIFFLPANTDRLGSFAYRANARLGALAISKPYSLKRAHSLVARPGRLAHDSRALVALDAMCRPSPTTGLVHPVQVLDRTNRLGIDRSGPGASWKGKGHDVQLPWGCS